MGSFFLRLPNGQYARSVNCLGYKNAVQVHLIGAEPIVQVKTWNEGQDHSCGSLLKTKQEQQHNKKGAARHGNQEPPGQAPRCTGRESQPQQTRETDPGTP